MRPASTVSDIILCSAVPQRQKNAENAAVMERNRKINAVQEAYNKDVAENEMLQRQRIVGKGAVVRTNYFTFALKTIVKMRKVSREMPAEWALEVMRKAPYITVSFIRKDGQVEHEH